MIARRGCSVETRRPGEPGFYRAGVSLAEAHRMTNDNRMTRRQFVAHTAAALGGLGVARRVPAAPPKESLLVLTATQALRAMRNGEISAESYASALLNQCRRGARLNAFITLRSDSVIEAARECDR